MKSQVAKVFIFLFFLSSCSKEDIWFPIKISAEVNDSLVSVSIINKSESRVELINPTRAVMPGQEYGIDISVFNESGVRISSCAMVEPTNKIEDDIAKLDPKDSITQHFDVGTIGRRYCLSPGKYAANFILKQPSQNYTSNNIIIDVK